MASTGGIGRLLEFIRAGYPPVGVPPNGFMPLLALLKRRLSDEEVPLVAGRCCGAGPPITQADIETLIERFLRDPPGSDDAIRVTDHLAGTGWLVVDGSGRLRSTSPVTKSSETGAGRMSDRDSQWSGPRLVSRMADLAASITEERSIDEVFSEVCAAAVDSIPGADVADIMLLRDGQVFSLGATAELATTLDQLQQRLGEGPCAQAAADTAVIRTDDLGTESRWPRYSAEAVKLGVQSCLSFKLYSAGPVAATMNVYGYRAGAWNDEAETIGAVLASHAAATIASSAWGAAMDAPLNSRERIGQAKGIIMERYGLDDICAFKLLQTLSAQAGIGLLEAAQRVIDTRTTA